MFHFFFFNLIFAMMFQTEEFLIEDFKRLNWRNGGNH